MGTMTSSQEGGRADNTLSTPEGSTAAAHASYGRLPLNRPPLNEEERASRTHAGDEARLLADIKRTLVAEEQQLGDRALTARHAVQEVQAKEEAPQVGPITRLILGRPLETAAMP